MTCQQCRWSMGAVDELFQPTLICVKKITKAYAICEDFEREAGTMEREDE